MLIMVIIITIHILKEVLLWQKVLLSMHFHMYDSKQLTGNFKTNLLNSRSGLCVSLNLQYLLGMLVINQWIIDCC